MAAWIIWAVVAVLCWGIWAIGSKLIGSAFTAGQTQACSTLGILPVLIFLLLSKHPAGPGPNWKGITAAFSAGILTCVGNIGYFLALNKGGKAATVITLTALYPLITVLLAMVVLRERLGRSQVLGIMLSLGAIYLFNIQVTAGFFSGALWYALPPILLWGIAGLLQKVATNYVSAERSATWFLLAFIPVAGLLVWQERIPGSLGLTPWVWVTFVGFFFAFGNLALLAAFARQGKASVIAPMAALYPLVSLPIAVAFFGERIGRREGAGIVLALLSVVALTREKPVDLPRSEFK